MNATFFMQDTGAVFGAERATLDLAAGLRAAGAVPRFYLIEEQRRARADSALREAIAADGHPLRTFPVAGRVSRSLARSVAAAFREDGGDVLHTVGYKANLHARLSGIRPVVATVHGWLFRDDRKERLYDAIDRWCLRRCDRVICLSRFYERLLRDSGVRPERLVRIPSGLRDLPAAPPPPRPAAAPVTFGMMGRFSEEKNHRMFLRAAARLAAEHPAVRFALAGQGPLEAALRDEVDRLGLHDAVAFPGYLPVDVFMEQIDVYVICSRIENLPYSILEAMAWGRPVIGTHVGGIPDLVIPGKTGLLTPLDSIVELADAMARLVEEPEVRAALGAAGRARVEQAFALSVCAERHLHLYRELVGEGKR